MAVSFPPCKINLGLQIISRRPDGYHNITTCFYPLPWSDVLEILPSDQVEFTLTGLAIPGSREDNLCLKAYYLLKEDFRLPPVQIHLHKIIPAGAGLGGGSSDAAHVLRLLNGIFTLNLSADQMKSYAAWIGSDCAFFTQDAPMMGTSRGEVLNPVNISLKGYYGVLVNPGIHVSTAAAYAGVVPETPAANTQEIIALPVAKWRENLRNDFEPSVFKLHPDIQSIKERLYSSGALYASMSGSGSSVFGIYNKEMDSANLFSGLPGWSGWL